MGVARHEDLICWQLARELRRRVLVITRRALMKEDIRFSSQWRSACRSVTSNIAEGFGRRSRREFARHLDIALASLREVRDLLDEAKEAGYITADEYQELDTLAKRIVAATARLANAIRRFPDL